MARKASGQSNRRPLATLGRLLLKNRSHRGYDTGFVVREDQLRRMIEVNTRIPSARNQQVLRFRPVLADEAAAHPPWRSPARTPPALSGYRAECLYHHLLDSRREPLRRHGFGHLGPEHAAPGSGDRPERHLHRRIRQGADQTGIPPGLRTAADPRRRQRHRKDRIGAHRPQRQPHLLPRKRHALRPKTPRRRVDNQGMIRPSVHSTAFHHRPGRRTPVRGSSE